MNVSVDFLQQKPVAANALLSLLFYIANNYYGRKRITLRSATYIKKIGVKLFENFKLPRDAALIFIVRLWFGCCTKCSSSLSRGNQISSSTKKLVKF